VGDRDKDRRRLPEERDSSATHYARKAKYGGLDVSQARKLKALEEENGRLNDCWPTPCSTMPC
jgi:hypothetical protein